MFHTITSRNNFNRIYDTINTTYCTLQWMKPQSLPHILQPFVWENSHSLVMQHLNWYQSKNAKWFWVDSKHYRHPRCWLNQGLWVQIEHFLHWLLALRSLTQEGESTSLGAGSPGAFAYLEYHFAFSYDGLCL
jgi:hypothetical protein